MGGGENLQGAQGTAARKLGLDVVESSLIMVQLDFRWLRGQGGCEWAVSGLELEVYVSLPCWPFARQKGEMKRRKKKEGDQGQEVKS